MSSTGSKAASTTSPSFICPGIRSWLNQIETYFSILQRKPFTPAAFASQDAEAERIRALTELLAAGFNGLDYVARVER